MYPIIHTTVVLTLVMRVKNGGRKPGRPGLAMLLKIVGAHGPNWEGHTLFLVPTATLQESVIPILWMRKVRLDTREQKAE